LLLPIVGNRTVCTRSPRASGRVVPQHPRRETTTGTLCRHSSVELRTYRYTALSAPVAFPTPFRWSTECSSVHRFPPQRLCTRRRIHIVKYKLHIPAGVTPRLEVARSPCVEETSHWYSGRGYRGSSCPSLTLLHDQKPSPWSSVNTKLLVSTREHHYAIQEGGLERCAVVQRQLDQDASSRGVNLPNR
jgi:hypothetical protein